MSRSLSQSINNELDAAVLEMVAGDMQDFQEELQGDLSRQNPAGKIQRFVQVIVWRALVNCTQQSEGGRAYYIRMFLDDMRRWSRDQLQGYIDEVAAQPGEPIVLEIDEIS